MERYSEPVAIGDQALAQTANPLTTATGLQRAGARVGHVATSVVQAIKRGILWFADKMAPLYRILKWLFYFLVVSLGVNLGINLLADWLWEGATRPVVEPATAFVKTYQPPILVALLYLLPVFCLAWVGHRLRETRRRLEAAFAIFKRAEELSRADFGFQDVRPGQGEHVRVHQRNRPFFGTYFPRKAVEDMELAGEETAVREYSEVELEQLIRQDGGGFLLIGPSLSGKTLTAFELLRKMRDCSIVSPDTSQAVPDVQTFGLLKNRRVIIWLDNLTAFPSAFDLTLFTDRIGKATRGRYAVVGTCRAGDYATTVAAAHSSHVALFCEGRQKLRLPLMTTKQRIALANTAGVQWSAEDAWKNYPLPGYITMHDWLGEMVGRFRNLTLASKNALRAMKLLCTSAVPITGVRVQIVLHEVFYPTAEGCQMEGTLRDLFRRDFLLKEPFSNDLEDCIHFGLLDQVVSYEEGRHPANERWDGLLRAFTEGRDVEALLLLATTQGRLGSLDRSLKAANEAVRLDPGNAEAYYHQGYTLCRLHKLEAALEANDRSLQIRPGFAQAYNNRAYILSSLGKLDAALEAVDRALALVPNFDDAHTNRAILLARLGKFTDALTEFKTAIALRESYYAYLSLGITLSRQEAFNDALDAYNEALRLRPSYPEAYLNRGITLARKGGKGDLEQALAAHEQAIKLRPDYAEAYMNMGQTLANLGRLMEALESLTKAIELQPDYALAYFNRGRTLIRMGFEHLSEAFSDFDRSLQLSPDNPDAYMSRGTTLSRMERFDEALKDFDRTIQLSPDNADACLSRGTTLSRMERFDEALKDFDRSLQLSPNNANAYLNRGTTLARMQRVDEALRELTCALTLCPDNAEIHFGYGRVLLNMKGFDRARLERALHAFDDAIRLRPDYPEAHEVRGFTLCRLNRDEEALRAFNRALEIRPRYHQVLFNKARTICFLARKDPHRFPPEDAYREAVDLLECAVGIEESTIRRISHDRVAFRDLRKDPVYGPRLAALAWRGTH